MYTFPGRKTGSGDKGAKSAPTNADEGSNMNDFLQSSTPVKAENPDAILHSPPKAYQTHHNAIKGIFEAAGVQTSKVTHAFRKGGAQNADIKGCRL